MILRAHAPQSRADRKNSRREREREAPEQSRQDRETGKAMIQGEREREAPEQSIRTLDRSWCKTIEQPSHLAAVQYLRVQGPISIRSAVNTLRWSNSGHTVQPSNT